MKRRVLTVLLAVVLAAVGTVSVLAYVHKADQRALQGMRAVSVLAAHSQIPAGTSASSAQHAGLLVRERLPVSSVPADAVYAITPTLATLVTSADIQPGQLLLRPMLVPAAQVTGALAIPRGMMAVTIALCIPEAVAGNLRAGSEVAVFNTFAGHASTLTAGPNCTGPHQQQAYGSVRTQVVLSRVEVLSVGPSAASTRASNGSSVSTQNGQLVTLAVSQADAERVIGATEAGLPYLALLTSSSVTRLDNAGAQP